MRKAADRAAAMIDEHHVAVTGQGASLDHSARRRGFDRSSDRNRNVQSLVSVRLHPIAG